MTVMSYLAALKQPISTVFEVNTDDNKLTHFIRASGCDFREPRVSGLVSLFRNKRFINLFTEEETCND